VVDLRGKPWNQLLVDPESDLFKVIGWLGEEERRCLCWLAKEVYTGAGLIVDGGSYLGASAYCLAEGLSQNRTASFAKPPIYAFDLFVALDEYVANDINEKVRPMALNDPYLDVFQRQTTKYFDLIKIFSGDICQYSMRNTPIEILFIDVAKTLEINQHLAKEFFPALIPSQSLVIQQDFYHLWHPYIHVTMEYLRDYFEILDPLVRFQSRLYRLKSPIPAKHLDRIIRYDFSLAERAELLARSAETSPSPTKEMLEAIELFEILLSGDKRLFQERQHEFELRRAGYENGNELWHVEARRVMSMARDRGMAG
jgi:hypothetical protein